MYGESRIGVVKSDHRNIIWNVYAHFVGSLDRADAQHRVGEKDRGRPQRTAHHQSHDRGAAGQRVWLTKDEIVANVDAMFGQRFGVTLKSIVVVAVGHVMNAKRDALVPQ